MYLKEELELRIVDIALSHHFLKSWSIASYILGHLIDHTLNRRICWRRRLPRRWSYLQSGE